MTSHLLPSPQRLRQIPPRFSWVDHRLVREGYFEDCSCDALALYLFLLTVADPRGLSYYSQPSLMKSLKMGASRFIAARGQLIQTRLIAYQHPLYQVLSLTPLTEKQSAQKANTSRDIDSSTHTETTAKTKKLIQQMRQKLSGGLHD